MHGFHIFRINICNKYGYFNLLKMINFVIICLNIFKNIYNNLKGQENEKSKRI